MIIVKNVEKGKIVMGYIIRKWNDLLCYSEAIKKDQQKQFKSTF